MMRTGPCVAVRVERRACQASGLTWEDALDDVNRLLSSFEILEDGPVVTESLISVGGRQIHDANIVATMLAHGERRTPGKAKRARLCR